MQLHQYREFFYVSVTHATALSQGSSDHIAFVGGTVIDPAQEEPIENATVIVADDQIQSVSGGPASIPRGARVVNLTGRYLVPGLIDAHVHIGNTDDARRALRSGVTTARSMELVGVGLSPLDDSGRESSLRA